MRRWLLAVGVLTFASACAPRAANNTPSTDRSVLTRDEMDRGHYTNVYDAVAGLRRNWLQTRGTDSANRPSEVRVYMDNVLLGGTDNLRNITPASVAFVRFYDGIAATTRWGTDHGAGVIFVSSRTASATPN